jgi:energy-coupling factor transporter ATP-binding protein EcfA2
MAYIASKSLTKDRPGFSISFRHPCRVDSKGKPGLKVRRGLGTSDSEEADALVAQMNELLADESWWNASRYNDAMQTFSPVVVDAFFDGLQAGVANPIALRDSIIPLPSRAQGYARVLFVGTTGAGKTSLLRHLIGSNPHRDRFPSTSTAKTTVSDIEVIPADCPYRAAVTFFSEHAIRANVEDCAVSACSAVWDAMGDEKIADKLLHHADQRFRLSYLLGAWKTVAQDDSDDDWDFGGGDAQSGTDVADVQEVVPAAEVVALQVKLESYIERIKSIAVSKAAAIKAELLPNPSTAQPEDQQAALEIFQSELLDDEAFRDLVLDIMDDIYLRFDRLDVGTLTKRGKAARWPELWTYETEDRDDFLRQVRWFSSNYAPAFGRLLTPLVDGIRVQGPLYPVFTDRRPKVVFLDGQGLGHTPDSSSSVTTHVTQRFADVDTILLVDNAEQPIQAAAQAVLRAVAASGNYGKLAIAFTHFDQVKGLNLPGFAAKRAHVLASVHNYLSRLRDVLNGPIVTAMERTIDTQCFMLGGLDAASEKLPGGVKTQLEQLLDQIERAIAPPPLPDAKPSYDPSGLGFAVQRAADSFQRAWKFRLGFSASAEVSKEHWTRVKALNRRIANELDVEYDSLRPVADFVGRITEEISNFLDHPVRWTRTPKDDTEAQEAIAPIRQAVFRELHSLALARLVQEHLADWRRGNDHKGKGSADRRAVDIRGIYELAAPVPGTVNSEPALEFMKAVREIVRTAIDDQGGEMKAL